MGRWWGQRSHTPRPLKLDWPSPSASPFRFPRGKARRPAVWCSWRLGTSRRWARPSSGRTFDWRDVHDVRTAAVVTENFACEYWSDPATAVGRRVREGSSGPWKEIVGVVGNVHDDGMDQPATPVLYWPMLVGDFWGMEFVGFFARTTTYAVRTVGPPTAQVPAIRRVVHSVNANLPLAEVQTLDDVLDRSVARTSFTSSCWRSPRASHSSSASWGSMASCPTPSRPGRGKSAFGWRSGRDGTR